MEDSALACLQIIVLFGLPFSPESLSSGAFHKLDKNGLISVPLLVINFDSMTMNFVENGLDKNLDLLFGDWSEVQDTMNSMASDTLERMKLRIR